VNSGAVARFPSLHATAIDHHDGQRDRRTRGLWRRVQGAFTKGCGPHPPRLDEFVADLSAKGLEVTRRDLQGGRDLQNLGGFLE
jgi:hypothetical protein